MKVSPDLEAWFTTIDIHEDISQLNESSQAWFSTIDIHENIFQLKNSSRQKPKIQKVPHMLRKIKANEKCFEPLVVSLGPIHHGHFELEQMEKLKIAMAHRFVRDSKKTAKEMYNKVEEVMDEAKEFYDVGVINGLSDLNFTKMMFLDGCFILQFIIDMTSPDQPVRKAMMKSNDIAFVHRDLFLLENQVPNVVLDSLMAMRSEHAESDHNMFMKFFQGTQALPPETKRYLNLNEITRLFNSLLKANTPKGDDEGDLTEKREENRSAKPIHLLDRARSQLIGERNGDGHKTMSSEWSSYRSAKELKTVGIHFHPSKTQCFTDVKFESNLLSGTLRLPPLTVDDSTKSLLLNMVAYETCPDAPDDFAITSYICLMDALIDQAEDVMELRSKGIILNLLGSDQQVADLFNEIGNDLVPNPNAYSLVKMEIEKHYRNKLNIWIAQWLHTHFNSPWTVLGLFAAIFVIALSFTQTYFTVFPRDKK